LKNKERKNEFILYLLYPIGGAVERTPVLNTQERKTYQNMRGETYLFIFIFILQSMGETDMIRRVSCTVE